MQQLYILIIALGLFWFIDNYLGKEEQKKRKSKQLFKKPFVGFQKAYPKIYGSAKNGWNQIVSSYQTQTKVFYVHHNYSIENYEYYTTIS